MRQTLRDYQSSAIEQLRGRLQVVAERKGYKAGWVGHQFKATFGVWPRIPDELLERVAPARQPPLPLTRLREIEAAGAVAKPKAGAVSPRPGAASAAENSHA